MNGIYGNSLSLMTKALDGLWKRQEVISNNLANVDTPGYKSQYVKILIQMAVKVF